MRKIWFTAVGAAGLLAMAGCGPGTSYGASGGSSSAPPSSAAAAGNASTQAALSTWTSPVGQVIVTGAGRTVYEFDKDTAGSGTSACTGACAGLWPAVTTTTASPTVSGVTGTLGTIPRADGTEQVTLDGHPLYTFSGDTGSGQLTGQSYMNLWWVVSPSGAKITTSASSSSAAPSSSAGGGYSTY